MRRRLAPSLRIQQVIPVEGYSPDSDRPLLYDVRTDPVVHRGAGVFSKAGLILERVCDLDPTVHIPTPPNTQPTPECTRIYYAPNESHDTDVASVLAHLRWLVQGEHRDRPRLNIQESAEYPGLYRIQRDVAIGDIALQHCRHVSGVAGVAIETDSPAAHLYPERTLLNVVVLPGSEHAIEHLQELLTM